MICSLLVSVWMDTALYDMSHARIIMGKPVPKPKTIGNNQFHEKGRVTAMSIMVKKYTKRCGQKAIAKNMPNMNDQKPLLWLSTFLSHLLMPWSCSWWCLPVKSRSTPQIIINAANRGSPHWWRNCLIPLVWAPMIKGMDSGHRWLICPTRTWVRSLAPFGGCLFPYLYSQWQQYSWKGCRDQVSLRIPRARKWKYVP